VPNPRAVHKEFSFFLERTFLPWGPPCDILLRTHRQRFPFSVLDVEQTPFSFSGGHPRLNFGLPYFSERFPFLFTMRPSCSVPISSSVLPKKLFGTRSHDLRFHLTNPLSPHNNLNLTPPPPPPPPPESTPVSATSQSLIFFLSVLSLLSSRLFPLSHLRKESGRRCTSVLTRPFR